jgi:eukaryotic-like serine/threonine-protein kinase
MKKGDTLNGKKGIYSILKDFEVTGGMSKVSEGRRDIDGKVYFIKEFLSPKYPSEKTSSGSPATVEKRKKKCAEFEKHHTLLNKEISKKSSIGGNLISAFDFFRNGTTYYKVSEKVDVSSISITEVSRLPVEQKLLIIRTITSSLKILHDIGIVHGDLKQDNILIKMTAPGKYVAKLIDFDNSYFSGKPPLKSEDIVGTQEYYSPELARLIIKGADTTPGELTTQSDVFALGILFSEYWSGSKPVTDSAYRFVWQAVLEDKKPKLSGTIPPKLQEMISKMLSPAYADRPNLSTLIAGFRSLDKKDLDTSIHKPDISIEPKAGKLKGKILGKSKEEKREAPYAEKPPDATTPKLKGKLLK